MGKFALVLASALLASLLGAGVPPLFNYQGELRDAQGSPLPDGIYDFRFRVYDDAVGSDALPCGEVGATCLWEEIRSVSLQDGVYSVLLGSVTPIGPQVFDGAERFLGMRVGQDSEMTPRQRIASVPYALVSGSSQAFPEQPGTFYCGLDWDGDGNTTDDAGDLLACLDAAKAALGEDRAATIYLQEGNLTFCDPALPGGNPCPYTLQSGMNLIGVRPRLLSVDEAPDLDMIPNGGSWIDGNGATASANGIFVGTNVRGVTLQQIGFRNYANALRFGETDVEGLSMSRLQDLYFVGISAVHGGGTETAIRLVNFQHVAIDHVKAYRGERVYYFANDIATWQGGNSVIVDLYAYTYPDPDYGVMLECLQAQLNFLTFIRPQVNAFNGTFAPDTRGFYLKGGPGCPVNSISLHAIDVEGQLEYGLRGEFVFNSYIHYAGGPDVILAEVSLDASSSENVIFSSSGAPGIDVSNSSNLVNGQWKGSETQTTLRGVGRDANSSRAWVKTDLAEVHGEIALGGTYVWSDSGELRAKVGAPVSSSDGDPLLTGTAGRGVDAYGPAVWADTTLDCTTACGNLGGMGC